MKVYVITSGEYSDYHIDAVALDEKEADMKCAALNQNRSIYDYCLVEEYDTEDMKVCTNEDIKLRFEFTVRTDGGREWFGGGTPIIAEESIKTEYIGRNNEHIECCAILPYGTTENDAKKIMRDHIAKFKAEQEGI